MLVRIALTSGLIAALTLPAMRAAGQVVACGTSFRVIGIPDFDQRRDTLPGNGSWYCAPTSFGNLMAYYATRQDMLALFPGVPVPQWPVYYDETTDLLTQIGAAMGTLADGGTDGYGFLNGAQSWLDTHGNDDRLVIVNYDGEAIKPQNMQRILQLGGTAVMSCAPYKQVTVGGQPAWQRDGGHVVTLSRVDKTCGGFAPWHVFIRDPWTNESPADLTVQSPFMTSEIPSFGETLFFYGSDGHTYTMTRWEMITGDSDGRKRLWDGLTALMPERVGFGISAFTTAWHFDPSIVFDLSTSLTFDPGAIDDIFFGAGGGGVSGGGGSMAGGGDPASAVVLRSAVGNGALTPVRLAVWDMLGDQLLATQALSGTEALMAVGRRGQIHVFNNNMIRTYRFIGGEKPAITELGTPMAMALPVVALGFDDRSDEVLALLDDARVATIPVDVNGIPNGGTGIHNNPSAPAFAASGRKRIAAGPGTTDYWIGPMVASGLGGPSTVRRFDHPPTNGTLSQVESVSPPAPPAGGPGSWTNSTPITDWSLADGGRMLLLRSSTTQELRKTIVGWGNHVGGAWFGKVAHRGVIPTRSRNMIDHSVDDLPEWNTNVLDPSVPLIQHPDCLADIAPNFGNDIVNIDDLLAVINAWGPCANPNNCPADIAPLGGNDVVNVDDLLAVINSWGPCQ